MIGMRGRPTPVIGRTRGLPVPVSNTFNCASRGPATCGLNSKSSLQIPPDGNGTPTHVSATKRKSSGLLPSLDTLLTTMVSGLALLNVTVTSWPVVPTYSEPKSTVDGMKTIGGDAAVTLST